MQKRGCKDTNFSKNYFIHFLKFKENENGKNNIWPASGIDT